MRSFCRLLNRLRYGPARLCLLSFSVLDRLSSSILSLHRFLSTSFSFPITAVSLHAINVLNYVDEEMKNY